MADDWIDRLRRATVPEVASHLGFEVVRRAHGHLTYACPACNDVTRYHKSDDKRGAVDVPDSKPHVWTCRQCSEGGDAFDFVAHAKVQRSGKACTREQMRELEAWTRDAFGLPSEAGPRTYRREKRDPLRERLARAFHAPRTVDRLDAGEVAAVWNLGRPVLEDRQASEWLTSRGIDPTRVALADLARAVPGDVEGLPEWAGGVPSGGPFAGRWASLPARGWRLIVPMFDTDGAMRSVRFRRFDQPGPRVPKTMAVKCSGLVMADAGAVALLATRATTERAIVIVEGEADFLRVATDDAPAAAPYDATFGIVAGSITSSFGRRIPRGSVLLATDADEQGDKYASDVFEHIGHRVRLGEIRATRWRPNRGKDVGDADGLRNGTITDYRGTEATEANAS